MMRDQLDGLLAREVLDVKPQHEHACKVLVNLALQARVIVRCMTKAQPAQGSQPLGIILDDMDLAKGDDALEVGREGLRVHLVLGNDTVAALGTVPDGIHLVPLQGRMEIETAVGIDVAQRHGIGVATVTRDCQHA